MKTAEQLFNAYNSQGPNPWKTFDGRDVPRWDSPTMTDQVRAKWEAVARELEELKTKTQPGGVDGVSIHSSLKDFECASVLMSLALERRRQDQKWGQQNHLDGTASPWWKEFGHTSDLAKQLCGRAAEQGSLTWFHILHEEMCEAFEETDPKKLRVELIQTAAVIVAWIEAIERRPRLAFEALAKKGLNVYANETEWFVATSPEHAEQLCRDNYGEVTVDETDVSAGPWNRIPDDAVIDIKSDETGKVESKTAREWCDTYDGHTGFLASSEHF